MKRIRAGRLDSLLPCSSYDPRRWVARPAGRFLTTRLLASCRAFRPFSCAFIGLSSSRPAERTRRRLCLLPDGAARKEPPVLPTTPVPESGSRITLTAFLQRVFASDPSIRRGARINYRGAVRSLEHWAERTVMVDELDNTIVTAWVHSLHEEKCHRGLAARRFRRVQFIWQAAYLNGLNQNAPSRPRRARPAWADNRPIPQSRQQQRLATAASFTSRDRAPQIEKGSEA